MPNLLQKLLTTNIIRKTDKDYYLLKKSYPVLKDQLYNDTGLELVQLPNAFKLQLIDTKNKPIFSSLFAYGMYFLILSALVSEKKDAIIPMETFAQQIINATPDSHENRDVIFKKVIQKIKDDGFISIDTEYDTEETAHQIITKKNDPAIAFETTPKEPLSPTTQIINYLLTHPSMNKRDHKHLWKDVTITDVRRQLEPYSNDDAGYDIYTNGDTIRLISKNDNKAFPQKNATHLVTLDFMCHYQNNETLDDFIDKSPYKSKTLTDKDVKQVITDYDLTSLQFKHI